MAAVRISNLSGIFKAQSFSVKGLSGSMDRWAGRAMTRARLRGGMLGSIAKTQGLRSAAGVIGTGMRAPAMRGAMIGAALGAGGAAVNDTMNGNLGFGTAGHMLGGAFRGGLMGGVAGGAFGGGRMMMGRSTMMRSAFRSPAAGAARRAASIRSNAAFEMGLR